MTESKITNELPHYSYGDKYAKPGNQVLMDALNGIVQDNPGQFPLRKKLETDDKNTDKPGIKSMPTILADLKEVILNPKWGKRTDIYKLPNISEDAAVKEAGARTLEELDLPRYKRVEANVNDFLKNPEKYFDCLSSNLYFPSVMKKITGERYFKLSLDKLGTIHFLRNLLVKKIISDNDLLMLCEYQENFISGNITINPPMNGGQDGGKRNLASQNDQIYIEVVYGEHASLAYGDKSPVLIARTNLDDHHPSIMGFDISLKTMEFSSYLMDRIRSVSNRSHIGFLILKEMIENSDIYGSSVDNKDKKNDQEAIRRYQELIQKIIGVLNLIPKDQDNGSNFSVNGKAFHPGYYEFIINPQGKPYFLDYRLPDHYSNLQHNDTEIPESSD